MEYLERKITVFEPSYVRPLYVVQNSNMREIRIIITDWDIPSGADVYWQVATSTKGELNVADVDGNTIYIRPYTTTFSEAGQGYLQVRVEHDGRVLISFSVDVYIQPDRVSNPTEGSNSDVIRVLVEQYVDDATGTLFEDLEAQAEAERGSIEAVGEQVIESIPSDYTKLSTTVNGAVEYITPINWLDESELVNAPDIGTHFARSGYIPVKQGDVCRYYFGISIGSLVHSSVRRWTALDEDKQPLDEANNIKEYTVTNADAKYIQVVVDTDKTNKMVQINTNIMTYSEYFEPYYIADDEKARNSVVSTNDTIKSIVFDGKMHISGTYMRAGLTSGNITHAANRVAESDLLSFDTVTTVYIADGFKVGFHLFTNGTFVSDSGWKTGFYVIPQGYSFKFVIARNPEVSSEVISDIQEFINAVSIKPYLIQKAKGINPCFMSVSHRGYSNTSEADGRNKVASYINSYHHGFDCVETDIQWSSDGVPVCCHDETFTDSNDGTTIITISEHTLTELKTYGYYGDTISTLEEVISTCKNYGMKVQFDKIVSAWTDAQWNAVFTLVTKYKMQKLVIWQVPYDQVSKVLEYDKFATLMLLTSKSTISATITQAKAVATDYNEVLIALYYSGVTVGDMASYNAQITERNISIGMYTIDDIPNYLKYVPYASFITSNRLCLNDIVG